MEVAVSDIRVRFAPSPTGELHIGGARTALFNYLYSCRFDGTFVLRIDDTDTERSTPEFTAKLIQALNWLGLKWNEGPYYQSKRQKLYQAEASRLIAEKKAYRCYCSMEELEKGREKAHRENRAFLYPGTCRNLTANEENRLIKNGNQPVIRLLTPGEGETVVHDLIRGEVHFENTGIDDFIIVKSNGQPTYNFASVVDDLLLRITHVIRAEEHLSNTPRQVLCAFALGYNLPVYAHLSMILAPDRSKLSKRHGATSVEEFRSQGFLAEALINYLSLLGWSPGGSGEEDDIFALEQMCQTFTLEKVTKTAAIYDLDKLIWMNGYYIRSYDLGQLTRLAQPFFVEKGLLKDDANADDLSYLKKVIALNRERAKTLVDLANISNYFFTDQFVFDQKGVEKVFNKEGAAEILRQMVDILNSTDPFKHDHLETQFANYCEQKDISLGKVIQPVRLAVTGLTGGPGLFDLMELLGREKTIARLERAISFIGK
jgi:glutamyl-tRNA synthetase